MWRLWWINSTKAKSKNLWMVNCLITKKEWCDDPKCEMNREGIRHKDHFVKVKSSNPTKTQGVVFGFSLLIVWMVTVFSTVFGVSSIPELKWLVESDGSFGVGILFLPVIVIIIFETYWISIMFERLWKVNFTSK
jgi:hypothetical protein